MKYVDTKLEYMNMYNWTNDLPDNSNARKDFLEILEYFNVNLETINNQTKILEIGTYCGVSLVHILQEIPNSKATVIDKWVNYDECSLLQGVNFLKVKETFYNNMKVSGQIDKLENVYNEDSHKILMNLLKMNEKFDLIYVDGSHRCLDCYLDIEISFELLNKKGILIIDDVPYLKEQILESPYEAVIHFLKRNEGQYKILKNTYRLFLEKI